MNERINELFARALDQAVPETWTTLNPEQLSKLKTKFALLIIQECLNQCYYRGMNDELYAGQLKAAAYIEQHFGVDGD